VAKPDRLWQARLLAHLEQRLAAAADELRTPDRHGHLAETPERLAAASYVAFLQRKIDRLEKRINRRAK
jgi:transcription elongation GreA/GreB family factor